MIRQIIRTAILASAITGVAIAAFASDESGLLCKPVEGVSKEPVRLIQLDPSVIKIRALGEIPDRYYAFVGTDRRWQLFGEKASQNEPMKLVSGSPFHAHLDFAEGGTHLTLIGAKLKQHYTCAPEPKSKN